MLTLSTLRIGAVDLWPTPFGFKPKGSDNLFPHPLPHSSSRLRQNLYYISNRKPPLIVVKGLPDFFTPKNSNTCLHHPSISSKASVQVPQLYKLPELIDSLNSIDFLNSTNFIDSLISLPLKTAMLVSITHPADQE